jgi:hypothetical protein
MDEAEEERAARLSHSRRRSSQTSSENAAALQRVLSLTQRNRMVSNDVHLFNMKVSLIRFSRL